MHFDETEIGDYKVYAGALEAPGGGYTASVAVEQVRGLFGAPRRIHAEDQLCCAHRFDEASSALKHALSVGRKAVYAEIAQTARPLLVHG